MQTYNFGSHFLCLYAYTHKEIKKTALGAEETVEWMYFPNAIEAIDYLKNQKDRVQKMKDIMIENLNNAKQVIDF